MSITIERKQRHVLRQILLRPRSLAQLTRARVVHFALKGEPLPTIARRLQIPRARVSRYLERFNQEGIAYLKPSDDQRKSRRQLEEEYYDKVQFHEDLEEILQKDAELLRRLAQ